MSQVGSYVGSFMQKMTGTVNIEGAKGSMGSGNGVDLGASMGAKIDEGMSQNMGTGTIGIMNQ